MRFIILLSAVLFLALLNSPLFAAELVQREGNDLVVYQKTETQRYKNVPKEIPVDDAIKIIQASRGEYTLPQEYLEFSWRFAFPIILTTVSKKLVMRYQDSKWEPATVIGPPRIADDWAATILVIVLSAVALFMISVGNQKTAAGDIRLLFPYGIILAAPLIGYWGHLGVSAGVKVSTWSVTQGFIVALCAVVISIFSGIFCCQCKKEGWMIVAFICAMLSVVMNMMIGLIMGDSQGFLASHLIFLVGSCLGAYILSKIIKVLFFKQPATPPISNDSN